MNVTKEEIDKFLGLFDPAYRDDVIDLIHSKTAAVIKVFIRRKCDTGVYYGNYISIIECVNDISSDAFGMDTSTLSFIRFNSELTYVEDDIINFVISFISRYFDNFKLIFSSALTHIFAIPNVVIDTVHIRDTTIPSSSESHKTLDFDLYAQGHVIGVFEISEDNSDFSDELWKFIVSDREHVKYLVKAYMSGEYVISEKIRKRINKLYESLSDSDKLLLELGEDI